MLRCLFITPIYNISAQTGGGQRTLHVYQALAKLCAVDLVLLSEPRFRVMERYVDGFRADFPLAQSIVIHRSTSQFLNELPESASLAARWKHAVRRVHHAVRPRSHFFKPPHRALKELERMIQARPYDVIVGRSLQATALAGALDQDSVPVVVDLDDLDDAVLRSTICSPTTSIMRRWVLRLQLVQVIPLAERLRARCWHIFTATEADRAAVDHPSASVLPNIPYRREGFAPEALPNSGANVLFVGSYAHRPNREGVRHFLTKIWPGVRRRVGEARFRIVGSGGWQQIEAVAGVDVVGRVDDLTAEYESAALCVAPVYEGSGTKIKIVEALMYGRVVVAAAHSTRGFEELLERGVIKVASDAEMIEQCVSLLQDPSRRASMAVDGRRLVRERYSPESVLRIVGNALSGLNASTTAP